MKKTDKKNKMFDLHLFGSKKEKLLKMLDNQLKNGVSPMVVFTPNPEQVVLAEQNPEFAKVLGGADILLPDGIGLVLASRMVAFFASGEKIAERITGLEVAEFLLKKSGHERVLIVGGRDFDHFSNHPYSVEKVTTESLSDLCDTDSTSSTVWWLPAYARVSTPTDAEEQFVQRAIATLRPTVILVAFGAPHQEFWIASHTQALADAGVRIAMVVGGAFDVIFGKLKSAPQLWQTLGIEWLYRLVQEPWRWKRQLRLLTFIQLVFEEIGNRSSD